MNLTTLEQSKRLKEWGAPQSTDYSWIRKNRDSAYSLDGGTWRTDDLEGCFAAYDLESLIGWLTKDMKDPSESSFSLSTQWETGEWIAYIEHADFGRNIPRHKFKDLKSDTPLDAVYNLCEAIHSPANKEQ